jgi:hypothetical protein
MDGLLGAVRGTKHLRIVRRTRISEGLYRLGCKSIIFAVFVDALIRFIFKLSLSEKI